MPDPTNNPLASALDTLSNLPATVKLVPGKSDAEKAKELREKVEAAVGPMLEIFTAAKAEGFEVMYSIQMDGLGHAYLHTLKIMKEY